MAAICARSHNELIQFQQNIMIHDLGVYQRVFGDACMTYSGEVKKYFWTSPSG